MTAGIFSYFIPVIESHNVKHDTLLELGLRDALWDVLLNASVFDQHVSRMDCAKGPTGSSGTIVFALPAGGGRNPKPGYHPNEQTWIDCDGYWLGYANNHKPSPQMLQRETVIDGYEHMLGDGQVWTCPIIRRAWLFPCLPQSIARHRGEIEREVLPEYAKVWQASATWLGALTDVELLDCAVAALSVAYRVSYEECRALNLMNSTSMQRIRESALDAPWWEEADSGRDPKKKTWRTSCDPSRRVARLGSRNRLPILPQSRRFDAVRVGIRLGN